MGQKYKNFQRQQQQTKRLRLLGNIGLAVLMLTTLAILLWVFVLG